MGLSVISFIFSSAFVISSGLNKRCRSNFTILLKVTVFICSLFLRSAVNSSNNCCSSLVSFRSFNEDLLFSIAAAFIFDSLYLFAYLYTSHAFYALGSISYQRKRIVPSAFLRRIMFKGTSYQPQIIGY